MYCIAVAYFAHHYLSSQARPHSLTHSLTHSLHSLARSLAHCSVIGLLLPAYVPLCTWFVHGAGDSLLPCTPGCAGATLSQQRVGCHCYPLDEDIKTKFHEALRTLEQAPTADGLSSGGSAEANSSNDRLNDNAAMPYVDFLEMVGLQDMKAELAEYLTEGAELDQLKQMDEDELDEDILDDLGLDAETKIKFHEALRSLQQAPAADEPTADDRAVSEFGPAVVDAAARAAAEREAQWPKWPMLQKMLPGLRGLDETEVQPLEEALSRLQAKEEELAATVAKEEELVAARDAALRALAERGRELAAKDAELAALRACVPSDEGVPPT